MSRINYNWVRVGKGILICTLLIFLMVPSLDGQRKYSSKSKGRPNRKKSMCYSLAANDNKATVKGNFCPRVITKKVSCRVPNGTETYLGKVKVGNHVKAMTMKRPRLITSFKDVTEVVYGCCPGFQGPNCDVACFNCTQIHDLESRVRTLEVKILRSRSTTDFLGKKDDSAFRMGLPDTSHVEGHVLNNSTTGGGRRRPGRPRGRGRGRQGDITRSDIDIVDEGGTDAYDFSSATLSTVSPFVPTPPPQLGRCRCPPGPPGPPGIPGRDGRPGELVAASETSSVDSREFVTGPAGSVGPPGLPGLPGPPGHDGAPGKPGLRGLPGLPGVGVPGPQGGPGIDGLPGERGPRGESGLQGLLGPQGPKGDTGAYGPIGPPGLPGPGGETGPIGLIGPKGDQGEFGLPGIDGTIGLPGPIGPQGPPGLSGTPGTATGGVDFSEISLDGSGYGPFYDGEDIDYGGGKGIPKILLGQPGPKGEKGEKGAMGLTGSPGIPGEKGERGFDGVRGPPGDSGLTGLPGVKGDRGDPGQPGLAILPGSGLDGEVPQSVNELFGTVKELRESLNILDSRIRILESTLPKIIELAGGNTAIPGSPEDPHGSYGLDLHNAANEVNNQIKRIDGIFTSTHPDLLGWGDRKGHEPTNLGEYNPPSHREEDRVESEVAIRAEENEDAYEEGSGFLDRANHRKVKSKPGNKNANKSEIGTYDYEEYEYDDDYDIHEDYDDYVDSIITPRAKHKKNASKSAGRPGKSLKRHYLPDPVDSLTTITPLITTSTNQKSNRFGNGNKHPDAITDSYQQYHISISESLSSAALNDVSSILNKSTAGTVGSDNFHKLKVGSDEWKNSKHKKLIKDKKLKKQSRKGSDKQTQDTSSTKGFTWI